MSDTKGMNDMDNMHDKDAQRAQLLAHDRAVERRLLWKGLLALLVVVALPVIRQRWWL